MSSVERTGNNPSVKHVTTQLTRNPPKLEKEVWERYNREFSDLSKESWSSLKKGSVAPDEFIADINVKLATFLKSKKEF